MEHIEHNYNGICATIIADSKNQFGNRITTFVLTFPRIVLAEFNTHRAISRNSASSRAIPFNKMVRSVIENPFIPKRWQKDHKGMQGSEYFEPPFHEDCQLLWIESRNEAVKKAKELNEYGVTKQLCNRILEPYLWHTVIATATEWDNFFALRAHEDAEIHIQELAYKMLEAYNESKPILLKGGEWHIPFGDNINYVKLGGATSKYYQKNLTEVVDVDKWLIKIATARSARISYNNFEGTDNYEADFKLHDRLLESGHLSPFEHCAKAMSEYENYHYTTGRPTKNGISGISEQGWSGNFRGFIQYRKMFQNENRTDKRVAK